MDNNKYDKSNTHNLNEIDSNNSQHATPITDYGPNPFVIDINKATLNNINFRTALWTGKNLQLTLMKVPSGEEIGLEVHPSDDQFIRIESGHGVVQFGESMNDLYFQQPLYDNNAIFIPAGMWHNIINTGNEPLLLYSIYAPPHHPWGTIHKTKEEAEDMDKPQFYNI